jgi:hypothetical protein
MAYRQYTECEDPQDYSDLSFTVIGLLNIIGFLVGGTIVAVIVAAVTGGPVALVIAITTFALALSYLRWWLYGRLICLGGEQCLIGMVRGLSPADPIFWKKSGDDDFSMNIMLAPGPTAFRTDFAKLNLPGTPPPVSDYQNALQGELVSPQQSIHDIGRGYVSDEDHLKYMTGLHCEFEGSGIYNLMIWVGIVLALLVAALALQLALGPGGWLVSLLIMLAIFFGGVAILTGPLAGPLAAGAGHPTDVDASLAELAAGYVVVVKGEWVYDSLHHGWNEIHPIRDCQIIGKGMTIGGPWLTDIGDGLGLDTEDKVKAALTRWCGMLDDGRAAEESGSRDNPANDWILHPLVDGCKEPPVIL